MRKHGHSNLEVTTCGFYIHPEKGWLGSSPDGIVEHSSCKGLLELKCPYTKRDLLPEEAAKDPTFYCTISDDGKFKLKRTHKYYHQVQLQLYVTSDLYTWCDFCIYTTKGVLVERIFSDPEWIKKSIDELDDYFDSEILPEIVYPMHKPSYYL